MIVLAFGVGTGFWFLPNLVLAINIYVWWRWSIIEMGVTRRGKRDVESDMKM